MVSKKFIIRHTQGIHMKPSGVLTNAIKAFDCQIDIVCKDKQVDAKSLMMLIAACIKYGDEIEVICDGEEEEEALTRITEVIKSNFNM